MGEPSQPQDSPSSTSVEQDTPVLPDWTQARRLMAALYVPGDTFHVLAYDDKKVRRPDQRDFIYDERWSVGMFLDSSNDDGFALATTVGAFFGDASAKKLTREADQCVAASAFGIDVDAKDFDKLVSGATQKETVIPEILRRLGDRGLAPHAIVSSGSGLHVYILIERVTFTNDEERGHFKDVWYRLGTVLGEATDRHDLSSILRLPGSIHRKAEPVLVRFVEEHTDLTRRRYTLDEVAHALRDVPPLPEHKKRSRKRAADGAGISVAPIIPVDPWDRHVHDVARRLDAALAKAQAASHGGQGDRSKPDYAYAARMAKLGIPHAVAVAEIAASRKGREREESYSLSTVSNATRDVFPTKTLASTPRWTTHEHAVEALSTGIEKEARERMNEAVLLLGRGEVPPASPPYGEPAVYLVVGRPGGRKTRGVVDFFSMLPGIGSGRIGLVASKVSELLRHEYHINTCYPLGLDAYIENVPTNFRELHAKLPDSLRTLGPKLETDGKGGFAALWTPEKLEQVVEDPFAFWVNCHHPAAFDEHLVPEQDEDGNPVLPAWAESWDDPRLRRPRAVLKFSGRVDLCPLAMSAVALRDRDTCRTCTFEPCRANQNREVGGAKTYWSSARYALLTHRAYETHVAVRPSLNHFDAVVFDEVPALVYRNRKVSVEAEVVRGNARWKVSPIDDLITEVDAYLAALDPSSKKAISLKEASAPVLDKLRQVCRRLTKRASNTRNEVTSQSFRADRIEPFLTWDEYWVVVKCTPEYDDDLPADGESDEPDFKFLAHLETLRDFCGDAPLNVYLEASFDQKGNGLLRVHRPVNGWHEALTSYGTPRPTILLDATAGIDPRYLLAGSSDVEHVPVADFPNTTIILTSERAVSKAAIRERGAVEVASKLVTDVSRWVNDLVDPRYVCDQPRVARLLVVTPMQLEGEVRSALDPYLRGGTLAADVVVDHFGGLRGRNDYRDFDAVYFTNTHRYAGEWYEGLELLLRDFDGARRQWVHSNTWRTLFSDALRHRAQVADFYQDALRIGIRSDPDRRAHIFVPTAEPGIVVRLLRLFRGAKLVLPNGKECVCA